MQQILWVLLNHWNILWYYFFFYFWYFRRKPILIIYRSYQMIVFHCLGHFLQLRQNLRTMTTSFDFFSSNWLMEKKRRKHIMMTLLNIYMFQAFILMISMTLLYRYYSCVFMYISYNIGNCCELWHVCILTGTRRMCLVRSEREHTTCYSRIFMRNILSRIMHQKTTQTHFPPQLQSTNYTEIIENLRIKRFELFKVWHDKKLLK